MIARDQLEPAIRLARRTAGFWRVGLAAFAIVLSATLGVAQVWPKQYRSDAVVYYREGMQWTANEPSSTRRIGQRLRDTLLARSQLAKLVEELGLFPKLVKAGRLGQAVEEMRLAVGFKVEGDSDVFVISYTGDSPEEAQRVAARLTDVLIGENARLRSEQAEVARGFLDTEKKRNEADLAAKEAEQLRFLAKHPEFAPEQATAVGASLRAKAKQGSDSVAPSAQKDEDALEALHREEERLRLQLGTSDQSPSARQGLALSRSEAEARLRAARRELADRRARYTEQHPDVRAAEGAVREAEEALRRAVEALNADQRPTPPAVLEARLARVQQEIAAYHLKHPERPPAPAKRETGVSTKRIVALESEWTRLNREVAEARDRLQQLDTKQFVASMTASMLVSGQTAQIVVIDPAFVPSQPVGMARKRLFLMALAMATFIAVGIAMLFAVLDDRVRDRTDVERMEVAPVLAEIARRSLGKDQEASTGRRRARRQRPLEDLAVPELPLLHAAHDTALATRPAGALAPMARSAVQTAVVHQMTLESDPSDPGEELVQLDELVHVHRMAPSWQIDSRPLMLRAPDSAAAASFRILGQRLEREGVRTILVASPRPSEGKTLCAVNLALALGEAGRARVLLLEANFRNPSLARLLGFHPPVCITDQLVTRLTDERAEPWAVVEVLPPWLHTAVVAPGGGERPALDGRVFAICVEELRAAAYDYVVVDGPEILGSADVNLMQESVDGILMTLWAGKSHARALRRAVEQIGGDKLLGVALLGT